MNRKLLTAAVLVGLVAAAAWAAEPTTTRVFQVRHCSVTDAAAAVQVLLTESGSLTVQPHHARITVQDRPEVVERAAEVIARMDRSPDRFRIEVTLLEGAARELPARERTEVDARLQRMFPFTSYRRIGVTNFEGMIGEPTAADLGEGHRVSFLASSLGVSENLPYGIPDPGRRVHLQWLTLTKTATDANGEQRSIEVLRTSAYISERQEVIIGAGSSENSERGLVLILQARAIGSR